MGLRAVFGLGNPGDRYANTRHNVGAAAVLTYVAQSPEDPTFEQDGFSRVYAFEHHVCVLPQTYMNLSGVAVSDVVKRHSLDVDRCLVVYDDVSIPFGHLRLRRSGSAGGQNGMQSVLDHLGCHDVPRLRVGIGGDVPAGALKDYVLSPFTRAEQKHLPKLLQAAAKAIELFLEVDLQTAMNRCNGPAL